MIGAIDPYFAESTARISECEAGRQYLIAIAPALEPWPEVEPADLYRALVLAIPYRTVSTAEQYLHWQRRSRGR
jgi:hypothetical protein